MNHFLYITEGCVNFKLLHNLMDVRLESCLVRDRVKAKKPFEFKKIYYFKHYFHIQNCKQPTLRGSFTFTKSNNS